MQTKPLDYAVSAGRDLLRFFACYGEARDYADGMLSRSNPNIGEVRIEKWNDDAGEYRDAQNLGAPVELPTHLQPETIQICGRAVKLCKHHKCGPDDTHVAWGAVGMRFGELVWSRYGITEELLFVWDFHRPATPAVGPQLADMPHVQRACA